MQIEKKSTGDLMVISLSGLLDNDSSVHFRNEIESCKRQGWHRIVVDLGGISYLSSAGISALIASKEQLEHLDGLFGIFNPVSQVEAVLKQVRLLDTLSCDPQTAQAARASGSMTMALSSSTRIAGGDGVDMEIYALRDAQPVTCRIVGNPDSLFDPARRNLHQVSFDKHSFGIGTGFLGEHSESTNSHSGEMIGVSGSTALSPHSNGGLPDYSVATEDFVPTANWFYGIQWSGELTTLIRFEPSHRGEQIGMSTLVEQAMRQTDMVAAAFVMLADCSGLVGAQMRTVPEHVNSNNDMPFDVPGVREWLSFGSERQHRHNLALIAGVATIGELDDASPLSPFVRQLDADGNCFGHFHAAVFPYKPLKKRTLKLHNEVTNLFETGAIEDVLHLLRDDRPITGTGESELLSGACWISPIDNVATAEGIE